MTMFFTSDTHFNHTRILTLGKGRPFKTIEEMNETIISNWNKVVEKNDTVFHLGDFGWGMKSSEISRVLNRLNGHKILVVGNHDQLKPHYESHSWQMIVKGTEILKLDRTLILNHFPFAEWEYAYDKSIHLHGHTHNTFDFSQLDFPHKNHQIMDIGVDAQNFTPISYEEVIDIFKKRGTLL